MNPEVLEKVLACKTLPSLPAVAMRVVELTQNSNVSIKELAETIQNDQGLTTKILRTVNSSLFGLRQRCSSINQAIVMLGLSAVKTLALGFSLVSAIKGVEPEDFDMSDYWRRSLYSGIAAKCVAAKAGVGNQEEAFLGGLLQDVGMIALMQTLGAEYAAIVKQAGADHRALSTLEVKALEVQHADIGAMLAKRWRLPEELLMPIKYHDRPTAAPSEHLGIVRSVGLGNIAAEFLSAAEPGEPLKRFYQRCEQWFGITPLQADEILKTITTSTREVAGLLSVAAGQLASADEVLTKAREQIQGMSIPTVADFDAASAASADPKTFDELTGVSSRLRFDQTLVAAFEQCRAGTGPLGVAMFDVDGLDEINEKYGRDAGDAVLIAVAGRLERTFNGLQAVVARYEGGRFGVVACRTERTRFARAAETARTFVASTPVGLIAGNHHAPRELSVTVSIGLSAIDRTDDARCDDPEKVLHMTEQACRAAKKSGRNTIRIFQTQPQAKAA